MPRFSAENYPKNLQLLHPLQQLADEAGCTVAQLSLAWLLAQQDNILAIPGTVQAHHLAENLAAAELHLDDQLLQQADTLINNQNVHGARYPAATQAEIDTEEFI